MIKETLVIRIQILSKTYITVFIFKQIQLLYIDREEHVISILPPW
jgi:hypothetical protein